jgi:hypothetical protein
MIPLLLAAASSFLIGGGAAWSVPLSGRANPWESGRSRQDLAVAGMLQYSRDWFVLQLEGQYSGFTVSQPGFAGVFARAGLLLPVGERVQPYLALGGGWATMSGKSYFECSQFGCDPLTGSGWAGSVDMGLQIRVTASFVVEPFLQFMLPNFVVSQSYSPGQPEPQVERMMLLGTRLLFQP